VTAREDACHADGLPILQLADAAAWEAWLERNHADARGAWLKIAKKSSPAETVTYPDVLDVALCFGWIDGQRAPLDEHFFLQRFTPRGRRSRWSQINRQRAEALIAAERMRPAGLAHVDAARADGRWAAAYAPQRSAAVPPDLQRALDRRPRAKAFFETLSGARRYAFIYRVGEAKRPETRARRIEQFVEMLDEGRTL
jgi:uncharacterized protein YdeI (YjbR/CyaY-like superfamily)